MRKHYVLCLIMLLFALSLAVFAGESDPNLCHTEWAGQCQTQRQWEAGWCYANVDYATCAAVYPDITMQSNGQNANSGSPSSMSANGAVGQSAGNQANSYSGSSSGQGKRLSVAPTPAAIRCPDGWDCSTWPPKKLPPTPTPLPGLSRPSNPSNCPPGIACAAET